MYLLTIDCRSYNSQRGKLENQNIYEKSKRYHHRKIRLADKSSLASMFHYGKNYYLGYRPLWQIIIEQISDSLRSHICIKAFISAVIFGVSDNTKEAHQAWSSERGAGGRSHQTEARVARTLRRMDGHPDEPSGAPDEHARSNGSRCPAAHSLSKPPGRKTSRSDYIISTDGSFQIPTRNLSSV